ncbi:hypothetical protein EQ845_23635 [Pseudomonas putida]|nr:hypothetical protein EQ845_23635 [Pseudomonas putida]
MQLKGQAPVLEGDRLPQDTLRRGTMHELEALRPLLESALVQVQMPAEPRNFALRLVNVPEGPASSRARPLPQPVVGAGLPANRPDLPANISRSFTVAAATAFAGKPAPTSVSNQLFLAKAHPQRSVCATLQFLLANQPALPLLYIDTVNRKATSKKA